MLRFTVGHTVHLYLPRSFPYGTLVANVLGSLLIGVLFILVMQSRTIDPIWRMGIVVGMLGAFTTYSTFSLETVLLMEHAEYGRAALNMVLSVGGCLGGTWLGIVVARSF